uniref:Tf56 protein n=1 Tax=Saccharolobus shibatae TaxID=2286 RepID=Q56006_9CREN|nr:ORF [Saccharolobus shibatae B12]
MMFKAYTSSTIFPPITSTPVLVNPLACLALKSISADIASSPAVSAKIVGISSNASANASIANCSLPPTLLAYSLNFIANSNSIAPPPGNITGSNNMFLRACNASFILLSASSNAISFEPLNKIFTAFRFLAPSINTILSFPTLLSSTNSAYPKSSGVASLILLIILAPNAFSNFSISLLLTLLTANIPFLAKKCCAISSIPFWHITTLAPIDASLSTMSLRYLDSSSKKALICSGDVILILAEISGFSTSNAASKTAILALVTLLGIPGCTTSLSNTSPLTKTLSSILPPFFLSIFIKSKLTLYPPLGRGSATLTIASITMSIILFNSAPSAINLLASVVNAIFLRVSLATEEFKSLISILVPNCGSNSKALVYAFLYPSIIIVGCIF